ncbi:hypothetical protein K439DRAFT_495410 [Ramaria rubella]|nr:hypothetical protein K439DRAFT_495410 [Ramaria rubella]
MLCMQVFLYFVNYPQDPVKFKALVAFLWIMDSGHQIVISKGMWRALVTNFGNPAILTEWFPELFLQVLFTGIVGLAAHGFLVHRIWIFSDRRHIFPAILMPLAVAKCIGDIVYVTIDLRSPTVQTLHKFDFLIYYPNAVAAVLDIVIAAIMCWLLWKGRTGLKRSDKINNNACGLAH